MTSKFKILKHNSRDLFQICRDDAAAQRESNGCSHVILSILPLLTQERKLPARQFGRCFICAADRRPSEQTHGWTNMLKLELHIQSLAKTSLQFSNFLPTKHFCPTTHHPPPPLSVALNANKNLNQQRSSAEINENSRRNAAHIR